MILELCAAMLLSPCPSVELRPLLAMTYGGEVHIDRAFWANLTPPERAFVVAHEFGHIVARHNKFDRKSVNEKEFEADHLPTAAIVKLGLPCITGAVLLRRMDKLYGVDLTVRAKRIEALC